MPLKICSSVQSPALTDVWCTLTCLPFVLCIFQTWTTLQHGKGPFALLPTAQKSLEPPPRVDLHRPPHTLLISSLISAAVWACFGGDSSFSFSPRWSSPLLVCCGLFFPNWSIFRVCFWMIPFQPISLLFDHLVCWLWFFPYFSRIFCFGIFPSWPSKASIRSVFTKPLQLLSPTPVL